MYFSVCLHTLFSLAYTPTSCFFWYDEIKKSLGVKFSRRSPRDNKKTMIILSNWTLKCNGLEDSAVVILDDLHIYVKLNVADLPYVLGDIEQRQTGGSQIGLQKHLARYRLIWLFRRCAYRLSGPSKQFCQVSCGM